MIGSDRPSRAYPSAKRSKYPKRAPRLHSIDRTAAWQLSSTAAHRATPTTMHHFKESDHHENGCSECTWDRQLIGVATEEEVDQ